MITFNTFNKSWRSDDMCAWATTFWTDHCVVIFVWWLFTVTTIVSATGTGSSAIIKGWEYKSCDFVIIITLGTFGFIFNSSKNHKIAIWIREMTCCLKFHSSDRSWAVRNCLYSFSKCGTHLFEDTRLPTKDLYILYTVLIGPYSISIRGLLMIIKDTTRIEIF